MSKASTLQMLSEHADGFVVDPFVRFTVQEWFSNSKAVLDRIFSIDLGPVVIVRSAASDEDESVNLAPGEFYSQLDVPISSVEILSSAITRVIESYRKHYPRKHCEEFNEVIVQRQLCCPRLSGVLSSRDLTSYSPYYMIEYDDKTGHTNTVTSGRAYKKNFIFRGLLQLEAPWDSIVSAARSVERLLASNDLIIEFALSQNGQIHIFQARRHSARNYSIIPQDEAVLELIETGQFHLRSKPLVVWSDMTDWNPAEMLGNRPRPLDISLYEYLITNETWAIARASLGYTDMRPKRLMELIACKPYINAEASFQSLTPSTLEPALRQRLVNNYLNELREHPELHDKVELELLFTCADIVVPRRTQVLHEKGFNGVEITHIEEKLHLLTISLFTGAKIAFNADAVRRTKLLRWRKEHWLGMILSQNLMGLANNVYISLLQCQQLGVYSFARLARLAFIGRDLIDRLVVAEVCSQEWLEIFWRSLQTVSSKVAASLSQVAQGQLSKQSFDEQFGHLRPHTYDITSPRYDQMDVLSLSLKKASIEPDLSSERSTEVLRSISYCLTQSQLPVNANQFLNFVKAAVEERERSKFEFSAVLSDCLETIAEIGKRLELSRTELSYLTIEDILVAREHSNSPTELRSRWIDKIAERRTRWQTAESLRLPSVILDAEDLVFVKHFSSRPNFITLGMVEGMVVVLENGIPNSQLDLRGKIVVVEAADPGFDWLFSYGIGALVTLFGGAASHMAIRCAQFGIPAIIGSGEDLYREISSSKRISIDCQKKEVLFLE